jgi:arginine decarboxylase
MIPRTFFVTSGQAFSPISELNALDKALKNAGIAQCNLVPVTSIIPEKCLQTEKKNVPVGAVTHAVIARMNGVEGQKIGAAIAWAFEKNNKFGIVAEAHGFMNQEALLESAEWKMKEMAKIRETDIGEINFEFQVLKVPTDNYGCVIAALVFYPNY